MEFRPMSLGPPIDERDTATLVDDFCIALRHVACGDGRRPTDPWVSDDIESVKAIHRELAERKRDVTEEISGLSQATSWDMAAILAECLGYPTAVPYVREADGIRRVFRCHLCSRAETPDLEGIRICDLCLTGAIAVATSGGAFRELFVYKTWTSSMWCKHGTPETIMVALTYESDGPDRPHCAQCLKVEADRRQKIAR